MDERAMLRVTWSKVIEKAAETTDQINTLQAGFRSRLVTDIKIFKNDVCTFRDDYLKSGPGVVGLSPNEAIERLRRYEDEFDILQVCFYSHFFFLLFVSLHVAIS